MSESVSPAEAVAALVRDELRATGRLTPGTESVALGVALIPLAREAAIQVAAAVPVVEDAPDDVKPILVAGIETGNIQIGVIR